REAADHSVDGGNPAHLPGRQLLFHRHVAAALAEGGLVQSHRVPHQRLPLELLRHFRRQHRCQFLHGRGIPAGVLRSRLGHLSDRVQAQGVTTETGWTAWSPSERESFFAAIARHRRAAWRVTFVSRAVNVVVALVVAVLMSLLFYGFLALAL